MIGIPCGGDQYITITDSDGSRRVCWLLDPRDRVDIITSISYDKNMSDEDISEDLNISIDEVVETLDIFGILADCIDAILMNIKAPDEA